MYDWLLQKLTVTWVSYIQRYAECGTLVKERIQGDVYPYLYPIFVITAITVVLLYYFYFNVKYGTYHTKKWYVIFMLIGFVIVFISSALLTYLTLKKFPCANNAQFIYLAFINSLYYAMLYFISSVILKRYSRMGKSTPF